ncbi:MAG: hypothetical protein SFX73_23330 [Kofleriaceae bacterium]|nr:hypothetical protein [Kofleriaceae bacterium]
MAPDDEAPPKSDPKVKDLLGRPLKDVVDEITAKELERWFGLPSFEDVEETAAKAPAVDPDLIAVRERRAQAIAAVDPALLASITARTNKPPEELLEFEANLAVHVDASIARFDQGMLARMMTISEPRWFEQPPDIEEELRNNTPQALLRDLHRPELDFYKTFEVVDMVADQRVDASAVVEEAMRTSWRLPLRADRQLEVRKVFAETRAEIRSPWSAILTRMELPNRRVTE